MLTRDELARAFPHARPDVLDALAAGGPILDEYGIDTPPRLAVFLAHVAHETAGLSTVVENMRYSAARIRAVWPSRFKTDEAAKAFANKPRALAERVYGGRMGNGKEGTGDGWAYRGRGLPMLTGRKLYRAVGEIVDLDLEGNPDLVLENLVLCAAGVWVMNGIAKHADAGDFKASTKAWNGGLTGYADRLEWFQTLAPLVQASFVHDAVTSDAPIPLARPEHEPCPCGDNDGQWCSLEGCPYPKPDVERVLDMGPLSMESLQRLLIEKGYHDVGRPDGIFGSRTRAAILAFQADNSMPLDPNPPADELFDALTTSASRPVAADRAEGVPEGSRIIASSDATTAVGGASAAVGALGAASQAVGSLEAGSALLGRVRAAVEPFSDLIGAAWPVLVVAAGVAVVFFALRAKRARIEDFRTGKTAR